MNQEMQCQYHDWAPSTHIWCEEKLCGWIREPANTWSNLAFIIVGIIILYQIRKDKDSPLKLLGYFSILLGFMSGFYHASSSFIGEVFDYSAMFLISTYFLCANFARLYGWSARKTQNFAVVLLIISVSGLVYLRTVGAVFFGIQLATAVSLEFILWKKTADKPHYRPFITSCVLFLIAYGIWNLDRLRIVCDPHNHWIQGHAIWHVLDAMGIYYIYRFYYQFEQRKKIRV